jgi:hypothetical protein
VRRVLKDAAGIDLPASSVVPAAFLVKGCLQAEVKRFPTDIRRWSAGGACRLGVGSLNGDLIALNGHVVRLLGSRWSTDGAAAISGFQDSTQRVVASK